MERERALSRLPEAHAEALRLRDGGSDEDEIAQSLQIPVEAVGPLLQIAETKLARLLEESSGEHAPEEAQFTEAPPDVPPDEPVDDRPTLTG